MWFVILCSCKEMWSKKKNKKNPASAPTLVLFERCHSFKDWGLQTLQKHLQPAPCSVNVNKREIAHTVLHQNVS